MGIVYDGIGGLDIDFQAQAYVHTNKGSRSRSDHKQLYILFSSTIAASWFDFTDPHSDIAYYSWRAGTTAGGDDVMAETRLLRVNKWLD